MRSRYKVRDATGGAQDLLHSPFHLFASLGGGAPESLRWIKWQGKSPATPVRDQCARRSGAIGVFRKTASSAATSSAAATPPTQAAQPNMSNSVPSTALPIRPPKK